MKERGGACGDALAVLSCRRRSARLRSLLRAAVPLSAVRACPGRSCPGPGRLASASAARQRPGREHLPFLLGFDPHCCKCSACWRAIFQAGDGKVFSQGRSEGKIVVAVGASLFPEGLRRQRRRRVVTAVKASGGRCQSSCCRVAGAASCLPPFKVRSSNRADRPLNRRASHLLPGAHRRRALLTESSACCSGFQGLSAWRFAQNAAPNALPHALKRSAGRRASVPTKSIYGEDFARTDLPGSFMRDLAAELSPGRKQPDRCSSNRPASDYIISASLAPALIVRSCAQSFLVAIKSLSATAKRARLYVALRRAQAAGCKQVRLRAAAWRAGLVERQAVSCACGAGAVRPCERGGALAGKPVRPQRVCSRQSVSYRPTCPSPPRSAPSLEPSRPRARSGRAAQERALLRWCWSPSASSSEEQWDTCRKASSPCRCWLCRYPQALTRYEARRRRLGGGPRGPPPTCARKRMPLMDRSLARGCFAPRFGLAAAAVASAQGSQGNSEQLRFSLTLANPHSRELVPQTGGLSSSAGTATHGS